MQSHTFTALILLMAACVAMNRFNAGGDRDAALWTVALFFGFLAFL